jgi:NIMA (never in mitosis gene a)-related kinase
MGLENLHSRGIMHRDLKSANVFKSANGYKLGDLNVSKVVSGSLAYTQTGTPYYASP